MFRYGLNVNHNNQTTETLGGYFAIGAIVNSTVNSIAQYDVFWHTCASIMTCLAAGLSIYFTLRNRVRRSRSDP